MDAVLFRIVEDEMPPLPPTSPELADFLRRCFTKSQKRRPTAEELFDHPWLLECRPKPPCTPSQALLPRSSSLDASQQLGYESPVKGHAPPVMEQSMEWAIKRRTLQEWLLQGLKIKRN